MTNPTYEQECHSLVQNLGRAATNDDVARIHRSVHADPQHAAVLDREDLTVAKYIDEWIPVHVLCTRKSAAELNRSL